MMSKEFLWLALTGFFLLGLVTSLIFLPVIVDRLRRRNDAGGHVHDWRYIAGSYVKQCKTPACGFVEFSGELPDGLKEWVDENTGQEARRRRFAEEIEKGRPHE